MWVNGHVIGHTKSGQLVPDVESFHAEDMAVMRLIDLCQDRVSGQSTII